MFNKSTRSFFFRRLINEHMTEWNKIRPGLPILTWREARLMFKGATVAAIVYAKRDH